jgi:hypothetical protein
MALTGWIVEVGDTAHVQPQLDYPRTLCEQEPITDDDTAIAVVTYYPFESTFMQVQSLADAEPCSTCIVQFNRVAVAS